jgi:hypothetical protein
LPTFGQTKPREFRYATGRSPTTLERKHETTRTADKGDIISLPSSFAQDYYPSRPRIMVVHGSSKHLSGRMSYVREFSLRHQLLIIDGGGFFNYPSYCSPASDVPRHRIVFAFEQSDKNIAKLDITGYPSSSRTNQLRDRVSCKQLPSPALTSLFMPTIPPQSRWHCYQVSVWLQSYANSS